MARPTGPQICRVCKVKLVRGVNRHKTVTTLYCLEHYRELQLKKFFDNRDKRAETMRIYHSKINKTEERRKKVLEVAKRQILKWPEKYKARGRFSYAVKRGDIKKGICEVCGEIKVQAHHYLGYDGDHWKDVKWLCRKHHMEQHRKYPVLNNK